VKQRCIPDDSDNRCAAGRLLKPLTCTSQIFHSPAIRNHNAAAAMQRSAARCMASYNISTSPSPQTASARGLTSDQLLRYTNKSKDQLPFANEIPQTLHNLIIFCTYWTIWFAQLYLYDNFVYVINPSLSYSYAVNKARSKEIDGSVTYSCVSTVDCRLSIKYRHSTLVSTRIHEQLLTSKRQINTYDFKL